MKSLLTLFCLLSLNSNALMIFAEDTENQYIRAYEETPNSYVFEACSELDEELSCQSLTEDRFNRQELISISKSKYWDALGTVAMDVATFIPGVGIGIKLGERAGKAWLLKRGYNSDGGAMIGHLAGGAAAGGVTSYMVNSMIDDMDPFIDMDLGKVFEALAKTASKGDLEDIEAEYKGAEMAVTVEDINFTQLYIKVKDQLDEEKDGWF